MGVMAAVLLVLAIILLAMLVNMSEQPEMLLSTWAARIYSNVPLISTTMIQLPPKDSFIQISPVSPATDIEVSPQNADQARPALFVINAALMEIIATKTG